MTVSTSAERLPLKTYTVTDGLANNYVNYVFQDRKNFLWFATAEGLSLFDGYNFTNFDERDGLPPTGIRFITEAENGVLWFSTSHGIARLTDAPLKFADAQTVRKRFVSFKIKDGDSLIEKVSNQVNKILFHPNGSLWALTDYGLYKAENPSAQRLEFEAVFDKDTAFSTGALKDPNGNLWFGVGDELVEVRDAQIINHGSVGIPFPKNLITDIAIDKNGRMLVSDIKDIFEFLPPNESRQKGAFKKIYTVEKDRNLDSLFVDYIGSLWIGTTKGMSKIADGRETKYTDFGDVQSPNVHMFANDREGNLWIGVANFGAKRLMNESIVNFLSNKLNIKTIGEVFKDSEGNVRAGLPDGSSALISESELIEQQVFDSSIESSPSVWVGKRNGNWYFAGENAIIRIQSPKLKLRNDQIIDVTRFIDSETEGSRFYEDEQGTLWIGKRDGRIYRGTADGDGDFAFESFPTETPFSFFGSRIIGDGAGGVWLAHPLFLGRIRSGRYSTIPLSEGLPEKDPRSIFMDSRGRLWIGLRNKGVSMTRDAAADNPVFTNYSKSNSPISSNAVRSITEDNAGRMYFATDIGVNRFDVERNEWTLFSSRNGLAGDLTYGVLKDKKGIIWAATNGGLSRIDTSFERKSSVFLPIYLTEINIAGKELILPETGLTEVSNIELDSTANNLTVGFVAPNFSREDFSYQYQLEGTDADWSKPSKERTVGFSLLPSGEYRFNVRVVNQNGMIGPHTASFEFRILSPLWRRWWFLLGALSLIGLIIYWLYRFRVSKLLEIERTRTRIATDLHDDIGTNLSKISLLSEIVKMQLQDENEERTRMLQVIGETSRESVGAMSDIVWAINPKKDSLVDMTRRMRQYAEDVLLEKGVKLKFTAPADGRDIKIPMDIRRELYLIYKEAVTNAVKHSECKNIEIDFQIRQDELFLLVKDDGKGFEPTENTNGNGLQNLKTRAEKIKAKLEIKSSIGEGTTVSVSL